MYVRYHAGSAYASIGACSKVCNGSLQHLPGCHAGYRSRAHPNTSPDLEPLADQVFYDFAPCLASSARNKDLHHIVL